MFFPQPSGASDPCALWVSKRGLIIEMKSNEQAGSGPAIGIKKVERKEEILLLQKSIFKTENH